MAKIDNAEQLFGWFFPDRDVCGAVAREWLSVPVAPSFAQGHAGELCHQVVLGRPGVSVQRIEERRSTVGDPVMMRDQHLVGDVVFVDTEVTGGDVERHERLADRESA